MDILAYLRAGPDSNVAVNHCTLSDISTNIDICRRHHDNARRKIGTTANAAATRNDPDPVRGAELADRIGILVKERELSLAHIGNLSETETCKDNLLDLTVDLPHSVNLFGHPHTTGFKLVYKLFELL